MHTFKVPSPDIAGNLSRRRERVNIEPCTICVADGGLCRVFLRCCRSGGGGQVSKRYSGSSGGGGGGGIWRYYTDDAAGLKM